MDTPHYDIAITGAGPVGSTLALLLASRTTAPDRIALIDQRFGETPPRPAAAGTVSAPDPRILALNHGSRILLEQLQAWPVQSASIETVHVSQRGRLGRTLIRHADLGVPRLGSVVSYDQLLTSLHHRLENSGISLIADRYTTFSAGRYATVDLDSGQALSSYLIVQSDGSRATGVRRQYDQAAVLATVRVSRPRQAWAYERFTSQGPLALLPHPQGPGIYGLVWCCPPLRARQLAALGAHEFSDALRAMFGDRLGTFETLGPRHVFDLGLHAGPQLLNPRTVAIGNAAQTLHPVAGQSLNLGIRDAMQLAQSLAPWLANPVRTPPPALGEFSDTRRADRWLTAGITDFLSRVFATHNPIVEHASGLGLLAIDVSGRLQSPLARHLLYGLRA